jgi:hypothetical protein
MTALVDASGVALELAHRPRIVSLIPSTTETLCRLCLSDALVGVTAYCVEPREVVSTKTNVGGEKSPDPEAIESRSRTGPHHFRGRKELKPATDPTTHACRPRSLTRQSLPIRLRP